MALSLGARRLPLHHISIRVPWQDVPWDGRVCRLPASNASCLILKNIHAEKNDAQEEAVAGRSFDELAPHQLPPCIGEHAGFMAPFRMERLRRHPYSWSKAHEHLDATPLAVEPFSAGVIPFLWMRREEAHKKAETLKLPGFSIDREYRVDEMMGRTTGWLQEKGNQLTLLDTFFSAVEPERSLCFFYAKRTPLSDDTARVIVGVGRVTRVGPSTEYLYRAPGELKAVLWERSIGHSIRPHGGDGFLLPYHELLALQAGERPDLALEPFVAFAPDEAFESFSYGAEHVNHDQAISALLRCDEALRRAADVLPGNWEAQRSWINDRLNELWRMRGPCPGLGSALSAYGITDGTLLAFELSSRLGENEDPWPLVSSIFKNPEQLGEAWRRKIEGQLSRGWENLAPNRRALLQLLSRFSITAPQAARFYQEHERSKAGIDKTDDELLANPYLFYELDRVNRDPIDVRTIDRGVFPDDIVRLTHPLPDPSAVTDPGDARRVRALMASTLESSALAGDTVRNRDQVIEGVESLALQPICPVSYDLLGLTEPFLPAVIRKVEMADGSPAYQLERLATGGHLIAREVRTRMKKANSLQADWRALLDAELATPVRPGDEEEEQARTEKAAALDAVARARISVVIGPAGTGKTMLLSVLCGHLGIRSGGILMLAPTGKATVQLTRRTEGVPAQTIAQFLRGRDQYIPETQAYVLSTRGPETGYRTVIIDEASMLTEEQLAAVFSAFQGTPVDRFVLVGDPGQLPPIGAGRPFVDIVEQLRPADLVGRFPRTGPGYAELTVNRRAGGANRSDMLLASWFRGDALDPGADEIWARIAQGALDESVAFVKWENELDLREKLFGTLVSALGLTDEEDVAGFTRSLGGVVDGKWSYFNLGNARVVESWQILSPVNGRAHGVVDLNRSIQRHFRKDALATARERWRKTPKPTGPEEIVYGDKVINVTNKRRKHCWPEENALRYVANGEIGVVIGRTAFKRGQKADNLWVEFSSQPGFGYDYRNSEFGEDGNPPLQLAYAITIHKSQGSEFGRTLVVLPSPLPMVSRELLYTAFTRQQTGVVILHQGEIAELRDFASDEQSETARRQTNLFAPPAMTKIGERYLEEHLVHRTSDNRTVRSKSEVIIANALTHYGVPWVYEQPFPLPDGSSWLPDFTIDDGPTGMKVIWEHLGLLHQPVYRARWEKKLRAYRAAGIVPYDEDPDADWVLVTTRDDEHGAIDSAAIHQRVEQVFARG